MNKRISARKLIGLKLFSKIYDQRVAEHTLRTLFWECTLRCNLACRHCGSDCKASSQYDDMPAKDFLRVIDTITPHVDTHKMMVIFSGGEPLMRRDLEQIGMELYRREYPWGLVTNGMLLDRKRFDSLMRSGLRSITVSLDGFSICHNYIRRNDQSFARAVEAIKLIAAEPGLAYDVVTCINTINYLTLNQFKEYLISIGVKHWRLFTIFPAGRAATDPSLQLPDEQFRGLMEFIKHNRQHEKRITVTYSCEGFLGNYETDVRDSFAQCNAGVSTAGIRIDGSITACTSIRARYDQGNIYHDDFWQAWSNGFDEYRNREWMRKGECAECSVFDYCRGGGMHLRDAEGNLMLCHYHKLGYR